MGTARNGMGVEVLDGKLYAVGGSGVDETATGIGLSSVERYDPATNAWEEVAPMGTARKQMDVVVLAGKLYAVGGVGGDPASRGFRLRSVEAFDPTTNAWEEVGEMATKRSGLGLVVL